MTKDAFRSLNSVTQLVLDALLEQQIEKLKFLSARENEACEAQQQPPIAARMESQINAGEEWQHRQRQDRDDKHAPQERVVLAAVIRIDFTHQAAPA
jgi:hypothetical protein